MRAHNHNKTSVLRSGAFLTLIGLTSVACANPVETSLRPQARPDAASIASERAARAASNPAGFNSWVAGFRQRAIAQGISASTLDRSFQNIAYTPEVIKSDNNQSEFKSQIWDYLDSTTSPKRVNNGRAALQQYNGVLSQIEARYGVEKEVVAAVWGMESTYGERLGDIPIIDALSTLAYDGRRGAFFEKQLIAALKIIQAGDVAPNNMLGSWAGAMGHTQFMPTSYLAYAVDFTGDGKRDIWSNNPTDALASTAAYLKRFGWTKGQPWGVEVKLPQGFNTGLASRNNKKSPAEWAAMGVRDMNGNQVPNYGSAAILLPAGPQGAAFMIFNNFEVISRYNNSEFYIIGVGHLSDRIAGKPEIQASWPRGYNPLSFEERKEVQQRLQRLGYPIEKIDGVAGPNTKGAIKAFQQSRGVEANGYPSKEVLQLLRR